MPANSKITVLQTDEVACDNPAMVMSGEQDELLRLREKNARLKELLTRHRIPWEEPPVPEPIAATTEHGFAPSFLATDDKITLFRNLFRGRADVYPQRWESSKGASAYAPACGNEWKPGICHKPKVKYVSLQRFTCLRSAGANPPQVSKRCS